MLSKTRLLFNDASSDQPQGASESLTFLIRTDARYATNEFRKKLLSQLQNDLATEGLNLPTRGLQASGLEMAVLKSVHDAYEDWGSRVLNSISRHLNYDLYGIDDSARKCLSVEFHDSHALAEKIATNADNFMKTKIGHKPEVPAIFVSLDEMFHECRAPWSEVAFSRLFSLRGDQQFGYTARPGKIPIENQIAGLAKSVKNLRSQYGENVQIVLLEDNVRQAKMLNWVIDLMDRHGVFENADLACISTCFCSASVEERESIKHKGLIVPLIAAVQLDAKSFEVSTPRDLFFDGYVVEIAGETVRLPGLFMDVEKLFKICPKKIEQFSAEVRQASIDFCKRIEKQWNVTVPISWFNCSKAISHVTGISQDMSMLKALEKISGPEVTADISRPVLNQNLKISNSPV